MQSYRDMVAPPPLAPGVRDFEGAPSDVGVNPERAIIHEMDEDAGIEDANDILHLGIQW
jgi:hypothetical protein